MSIKEKNNKSYYNNLKDLIRDRVFMICLIDEELTSRARALNAIEKEHFHKLVLGTIEQISKNLETLNGDLK